MAQRQGRFLTKEKTIITESQNTKLNTNRPMIIFNNLIIKRARTLRKRLETAALSPQKNIEIFNQLIGVYNSRLFGLCIYRIQAKWTHFPSADQEKITGS